MGSEVDVACCYYDCVDGFTLNVTYLEWVIPACIACHQLVIHLMAVDTSGVRALRFHRQEPPVGELASARVTRKLLLYFRRAKGLGCIPRFSIGPALHIFATHAEHTKRMPTTAAVAAAVAAEATLPGGLSYACCGGTGGGARGGLVSPAPRWLCGVGMQNRPPPLAHR